MGYLTREQILAAKNIRTVDVVVPEWEGTVRVRGMTGRERDAFEAALIEGRGTRNQKVNYANVRAKLVAFCVIDDEGKRVFTDADVIALGELSANALDTVFTVAQELSALKERDIEDLVANFSQASSDDSSSGSLES